MDYSGKIIRANPVTPTQTSASGVWTLDDAAAAVRNNSWPIVGVPNPISKSLRFNSADTAYLNRTFSSAGNRKTWTWSGWVKRSALGGTEALFAAFVNNDNRAYLHFQSGNTISFLDRQGGVNTTSTPTTSVFRDVSAWYHIVFVVDTTQATSTDRIKLYVNNIQQTLTFTTTPSQNADLYINSAVGHKIGDLDTTLFNGYMTEVNFIDGQALTPSSFGQSNSNTGVWEPKPYTGTYGGNGFYLNFSDSSGVAALGNDYSGNNNDWTPNNFSVTAGVGNDSLTDVPTQWVGYSATNVDSGGIVRGNYCTWNPLANLGLTLSNGNLTNAYTTNLWTGTTATTAMDSGKWYFEYTVNATATYTQIGVITVGKPLPTGGTQLVNGTNFAWGYQTFGTVFGAGSETSSGISSATTNDVISVAIDIDAGKIWLGKNGTFFNSGAPASGTNAAYTNLSGSMIPAIYSYGTESGNTNFGQRPFAYTPPSGFVSLCTTNLPTPTIGATATTRADDYFNTVLYTGNGATSTAGTTARTITGVGFQSDLIWVKARGSNPGQPNHNLTDAVRGANLALFSNTTDAEVNVATAYSSGGIGGGASDGFTLVSGTGGNANNLNASTVEFVSWNWNANGAGSSNTAGTITSTVSANTTAGFSVVTYTGNGIVGATRGHGCLVNNVATAPSMIIVKGRSNADNSHVYHSSLGNTGGLFLNLTNAFTTSSFFWNDTSPSSTVFTTSNGASNNQNGVTYVAYCFAPVAGYSAFGSYTGNGSTDGPFVYTGFRPAWFLVKPSSTTGDWLLYDNKRNAYNVVNTILYPNSNSAEATSGGGATLDFVSNGFKLRGAGTGFNDNGTTFVYAAFAENPFKYSLAR